MVQQFLQNYLERHQHPASQCLHLAGVPLTFIASVACLTQNEWWLAGACFFGGYALQFLGHAIEGNDAGEVVLVKKLLGWPYREFGPRSQFYQTEAWRKSSRVKEERPRAAA